MRNNNIRKRCVILNFPPTGRFAGRPVQAPRRQRTPSSSFPLSPWSQSPCFSFNKEGVHPRLLSVMSVLVPTKFPSVAAVMLACVASLCLLLLARIMYAFMRFWSCPAISTAPNEKTRSWSSLLSPSNTWSRSLRSALPTSLPFSLTIPEKSSLEVGTGVGVGLSPKRLESQPGSQFQPLRESTVSIAF